MTLSDWLSARDKNLDWLADQIGVSVASASRIVRGIQNPTLATVGAIERLTDGEVTPAEMLATYRAAQPTEASAA